MPNLPLCRLRPSGEEPFANSSPIRSVRLPTVRRPARETPIVTWNASGLLFENCNCQVVCPGHVHFSQRCTHERCVGFWAIRFDAGRFAEADLAGARAVVAYESPRLMIDGGWTEALIVDAPTPTQRDAVEAILTGRAGGPWEVLDRFVERRLPTRHRPVAIEDAEALKGVAVEGLLSATVEPIRGRDRGRPVTFQNMFNQIHAPEQVVARGGGHYDDGVIRFDNEGTHGLWSSFDWRVEEGA